MNWLKETIKALRYRLAIRIMCKSDRESIAQMADLIASLSVKIGWGVMSEIYNAPNCDVRIDRLYEGDFH